MMAATIETEPEFRVVSTRDMFEDRFETCVFCKMYDVGPDERFVMIQDPKGSPPQGINVVLNWFEELKRLVPTGKD